MSSRRTTDSFPPEIIQEILSRLPITSLFESRYVCQTWRELINDPRLAKLQYEQTCRNKHRNNTSLILYSLNDKCDLFYVPEFITTCYKTIKFNNLPFRSWLPEFKVMGSCNGFLCIANRTTCYRSIFICNPVTGEYFLVPDNEIFGRVNGINFGFGFDLKTKEYKVVRMRNVSHQNLEVEVHTLGTTSWRKIENLKKMILNQSGVLVNGTLHWLSVSDYASTSTDTSVLAVCLSDENLREFPTPSQIVRKRAKNIHLGELGGFLIMVDDSSVKHVAVWVMKDYYENSGFWTKEYFIKRPHNNISDSLCFRPLMVQENGEILVECNNCLLFSYNPKTRFYKELNIKGLPSWFEARPHVSTLVPLKHAIETMEMRRFCTTGFELQKDL